MHNHGSKLGFAPRTRERKIPGMKNRDVTQVNRWERRSGGAGMPMADLDSKGGEG